MNMCENREDYFLLGDEADHMTDMIRLVVLVLTFTLSVCGFSIGPLCLSFDLSNFCVDTGIYIQNNDFGGRAKWGATFGGYPDQELVLSFCPPRTTS